jgi:hypothetical protein
MDIELTRYKQSDKILEPIEPTKNKKIKLELENSVLTDDFLKIIHEEICKLSNAQTVTKI